MNMSVKLFHFLYVDVTDILFIGCLVKAAYPRTESELNIHVNCESLTEKQVREAFWNQTYHSPLKDHWEKSTSEKVTLVDDKNTHTKGWNQDMVIIKFALKIFWTNKSMPTVCVWSKMLKVEAGVGGLKLVATARQNFVRPNLFCFN